MKPLPLFFLVVPVLTAAAVAQSQGPYVGSPHLLTVGDGTYDRSGLTLLPSNKVLLKVAGINSFNPFQTFPVQGMPNIPGLLDQIGDIDGLSGGLDWIQSTPNGVHAPTPQGLGTLTFSVMRDTLGPTTGNGSIINVEANRPDGAAADLFSYILPGSVLAPPAWREVTMRAQDSSEISLEAPNSKGDLTAHDLFLIIFQQHPQIAAMVLPTFTGVYFSVSTATRGSVPPAWWDQTLPSGATILWAEWDHASGTFKTPKPFATYADLGLVRDDDVTAVSYDDVQGYLLFATDRFDIDPLLFARYDKVQEQITFVGTYVDSAGTPISEKMGVKRQRRDRIDAICAVDPFLTTAAGFEWNTVFGIPDLSLLPVYPGTGLSATVFRDYEAPSEFLVSCFTGWPKGGPPQPGIATGIIADPTYTMILPLPVYTRTPSDPRGDPLQFRMQMPNLPPNSIRLGLHWSVLSGNFLDVAPPAWIDW